MFMKYLFILGNNPVAVINAISMSIILQLQRAVGNHYLVNYYILCAVH